MRGWRFGRFIFNSTLRRSGEIYLEDSPFSHLGGDDYLSPVSLDDRIDGGQAEARSGCLGGEIRIEYPAQVFGGDTSALVGNADSNIGTRFKSGNLVFRQGAVVRLHAHHTAPGHCLVGIDHDIVDDLADLPDIGLDGP